jgi:hypothetical protein
MMRNSLRPIEPPDDVRTLQPSVQLLAARTRSLGPGKRRHRGDKRARRAARSWTVSFAAALAAAYHLGRLSEEMPRPLCLYESGPSRQAMVIRTQKITRPKRMVSRSRLSTPAAPSRQRQRAYASDAGPAVTIW